MLNSLQDLINDTINAVSAGQSVNKRLTFGAFSGEDRIYGTGPEFPKYTARHGMKVEYVIYHPEYDGEPPAVYDSLPVCLPEGFKYELRIKVQAVQSRGEARADFRAETSPMTWTYWRGKQHTEEDLPPLIRIARSTSWSSWLLFLRTNLVSIPGGSSTAMSSHTQMSLIAIPLHQSTRLRTSPSLAAMITQPLWNTSADTSRSLGLLQGPNT